VCTRGTAAQHLWYSAESVVLRLVKNPSKRLSDGTTRQNWQSTTPPLGGFGARHNHRPKRLSHDGAKEYQRVVSINVLHPLHLKTICLVCVIDGPVARNCYFHILFLLSFITFLLSFLRSWYAYRYSTMDWLVEDSNYLAPVPDLSCDHHGSCFRCRIFGSNRTTMGPTLS
jgi:hypothetical protein